MLYSPHPSDPTEAPQPQKEPPDFSGAVSGVVLLVAGLTFVMALGTPHATMGATRSVRLKWQEREPPIVEPESLEPAQESLAP